MISNILNIALGGIGLATTLSTFELKENGPAITIMFCFLVILISSALRTLWDHG